MADNRNTILAIVLSLVVLLGWQYFVAQPQMERQRQLAAQEYTGNTVEPGLSTEVVSASAAKTRRPGTKQSRADQMLQKHREALLHVWVEGRCNSFGAQIIS